MDQTGKIYNQKIYSDELHNSYRSRPNIHSSMYPNSACEHSLNFSNKLLENVPHSADSRVNRSTSITDSIIIEKNLPKQSSIKLYSDGDSDIRLIHPASESLTNTKQANVVPSPSLKENDQMQNEEMTPNISLTQYQEYQKFLPILTSPKQQTTSLSFSSTICNSLQIFVTQKIVCFDMHRLLVTCNCTSFLLDCNYFDNLLKL